MSRRFPDMRIGDEDGCKSKVRTETPLPTATVSPQMTGMPLLQAMASGVFARHEAIQQADNQQITTHVAGR
ncbi:MAG: hypothetical protein LBF85_01125 [Tannerella sp.]|nr:hypothetical protein [Tannerella sp.]